MYMAWFYDAGGIELWNRLYQELMGLDITVMPVGVYHPETFAWSNVPIRTLEDFQGLRYRTAGWWADILRDTGVSVVSLPAAELYPSLERGVVDAAEFSTPWADQTLSFHEVTRYYTGPGMHQPAIVNELMINRSAWEALPEDLRAIVEAAAEAMVVRSWSRDLVRSMEAVAFFDESGQERVEVDVETQRALREASFAYLDELATQDAFFAEVWESVQAFYDRYVEYEAFMVPVRAEPRE